jgi:ATP-dependent helicase HrpB
MLALPAEPRLARLLVEAERAGCPADGALVAALASERDILAAARTFGGAAPRDFPPGPSDVLLRMELFGDAARRRFSPDACRALGLEPRAVHAVERARRQLSRLAGSDGHGADGATLRRCILAGFPDRVARRRQPGSPRAVMVGATGVALAPESIVRDAELFVATDLERAGGPEARVRSATAIDPAWVAALFPGAVGEAREVVFDPARGRAVERIQTRYHDLVLAETIRTDVDRARAGEVLAAAVRADADAYLGESVHDLIARMRFLTRAMPELGWPDDPDALAADALAALAAGCTSVADLRSADVCGAMLGLLTHAQRAALEREAPADYRLPSGRTTTVRYAADRPPAIAARIQELFGLAATPRLAGGRVALVVELLARTTGPSR